jgi:hypothetical protein
MVYLQISLSAPGVKKYASIPIPEFRIFRLSRTPLHLLPTSPHRNRGADGHRALCLIISFDIYTLYHDFLKLQSQPS